MASLLKRYYPELQGLLIPQAGRRRLALAESPWTHSPVGGGDGRAEAVCP